MVALTTAMARRCAREGCSGWLHVPSGGHHRQPASAKEPITLFELQAWLGPHSRETTQHYARISPPTVAKAYSDAGYFARNVRTDEVLF